MDTWGETLLLAGAMHSIAFAVFHLFFWRLFDWRTQLPRLSDVNRGVMQVLNVCLTYVFAGLGIVLALNAPDVVGTRLGTHLLVFLSGFWALRLTAQFVWFRTGHWAAWVLSGLFLAGAILPAAAAWAG